MCLWKIYFLIEIYNFSPELYNFGRNRRKDANFVFYLFRQLFLFLSMKSVRLPLLDYVTFIITTICAARYKLLLDNLLRCDDCPTSDHIDTIPDEVVLSGCPWRWDCKCGVRCGSYDCWQWRWGILKFYLWNFFKICNKITS